MKLIAMALATLISFSANAEFFDVTRAACADDNEVTTDTEILEGERIYWNRDKALVGFGYSSEEGACRVVDFYNFAISWGGSSTTTDNNNGDSNTSSITAGYLSYAQARSEGCSVEPGDKSFGVVYEGAFLREDSSVRAIAISHASRCEGQNLYLYF